MSISVFSNHFIERQVLYLMATQRKQRDEIEMPTISEALDTWINRKDLITHWCPEILLSLHPGNEIADRNIFNRVCADNRLRKIEQWVTKNILMCVRKDWKIQTRNVKFRIVAGMLNNLVSEKCITHEENIYIFDNIVKNMQELSNDLIYADLPF